MGVRQFFSDHRGAVAVFVTLMLIPSILVTGTGVDMARIYAGSSILQDANQLTANMLLSQYDPYLHDLYGIYAFTMDDGEATSLANAYIKQELEEPTLTMYSYDSKEFPLFQGTLPESTVQFNRYLTLGSTYHQLRQQMEEVAALRAPYLVRQEMLESAAACDHLIADARVIDAKLQVEACLLELEQVYRDLYSALLELKNLREQEDSILTGINDLLQSLAGLIGQMAYAKVQYGQTFYSRDRKAYQSLQQQALQLLQGDFIYQFHGIRGFLDDGKKLSQAGEDIAGFASTAESIRANLESALTGLENAIATEDCSDALKAALEAPLDGQGRSLVELYRDVESYWISIPSVELSALYGEKTAAMQTYCTQLDSGEAVLYDNGTVQLSITELQEILEESVLGDTERLLQLAMGAPLELVRPSGEGDPAEGTDGIDSVLQQLERLYGASLSASGQTDKTAVRDGIARGIKTMQNTAHSTLNTTVLPITDGANAYSGLIFGTYKDENPDFGGYYSHWDSMQGVQEDLHEAIGGLEDLQIPANLSQNMSRVLTTAYATGMFSCHTSGADGTPDSTILGTALGLDINYFYQSELEYLIHGDYRDAGDNVESACARAALIRFLFDYAASYQAGAVMGTVGQTRESLASMGTLGVAIGESARLALSLGETVQDMVRIWNGGKVPLRKENAAWVFAPADLSGASDASVKSAFEAGKQISEDTPEGMSYQDYMQLLLLMTDEDLVEDRIEILISLNCTNKANNIGSYATKSERESAMTRAKRLDLSQAYTGFTLKSNTKVKLLFLSMQIAQDGFAGVRPIMEKEITAIDYRGY